MKYEINFSKHIGENNKLGLIDIWAWDIIEASSEEDAINKLIEKHTKDNKKVNYIISCTELRI